MTKTKMQANNPTKLPRFINDDDDFIRLPGFYCRWEFEQVLKPGYDLRIEEANPTSDSTPLFIIYKRNTKSVCPTCPTCGLDHLIDRHSAIGDNDDHQ